MEVCYSRHLLAVESQVAPLMQDCPLVQAPSRFITGIIARKCQKLVKKKYEPRKTLDYGEGGGMGEGGGGVG